MEENENLYEKIREIIGNTPARLKVLEQQIDMDLQMEYYECSMRVRGERSDEWAQEHMHYLSDPGYPEEIKKEILARLASLVRVECFRAIESYVQEAPESMISWAVLAMNESRMLLESKLMDENQVFISTGLGGKDGKLRYFVVLMTRSKVDLTESQKMVIRNEFEYILKKFDAVLEEADFSDYLATLTLLLPMNYSLKSVFREAIDECNRYGDFLNDDFIVTNVRILSFGEIKDFLERKSNPG